ncbi:hypothetical protein [Methylobacterium oxalidis]|uniref:hypothetical protein n=1 Tax=Methylobacterium oxalidis TaxID=944322 RepID=UPI003315FCAC
MSTAEKDRFFDPHRIGRTPASRSVTSDVISSILEYEERHSIRKRKRKDKDRLTFEATITAVICDLMHAELTQEARDLVISRSTALLGGANPHKHPAENANLPRYLDYLSSPELNWISQQKAERGFFGQRTVIGPTGKLAALMAEHQVELSDLGRAKVSDIIGLRAVKEDHKDKGKKIKFEETPQTQELRSRLSAINDWIGSTDIGFDEWALKKNRLIDTQKRTLRRTFTCGSFECGGRLAGGFWIDIKKEERLEGLAINGEKVVSIDYGQIGPRILYSLAGKQPPCDDLYQIPGIYNCPRYREGIKKTWNGLTFIEGMPIRKFQGTKKLLPPNMTVTEIIRHIKEAHPDISHLLGTIIGHRIQCIESEIMVEALLRLKDKGIVALPVYDCMITPQSAQSEVSAIMIDTFRDITGVDINVSM